MKFLVFQHVPHEHPGRITEYCIEKGIKLDILEFWKPCKMPTVASYDALMIMGGPMGVYDSDEAYPSRAGEIKAVQSAIKNKIPVLGICLGSQLLAHALGARVYPNTINGRRAKEIGYYAVDLTPEGMKDAIFRGFSSPLRVLQWHGDAFDLPKGAKLLATAPLCANQAFSYGNAYGTLFHLEFTPEMVEKLVETGREWIRDEVDEAQLSEEAHKNANLMEQQCRRLFSNFVSIALYSNGH